MNTSQRILKNFLSLTFANIFTNFLGVITVAYLARILGPGDFGKINFALAVVGYFAILSHFGLNTIGTREIARAKEKINDYVSNILILKLCLGTIAFVLLCIFVLLINKPLEMKYLIILYGFTIFTANVLLFDWVFQGIEKMEYQGIALILQGICYLALILLIIKSSEQLLLIPPILVFAQMLSVIFLIAVFIKKFRIPKFGFNLTLWKILIKNAIPVGLIGIMSIIIFNTPIVLLGFFRPQQEVGYFAAAHKIVWMLIGLSTAFGAAIFPVLSYYHKTSFESFQKLCNHALKLMIILGIPTAVGITILAAHIINLVYGIKYATSVIILQILIWNVLLVYISVTFIFILLAAGRERKVLRISIFYAGSIVIFNLILILKFGVIGAAITSVTAGLITLILYFHETKGIVDVAIRQYTFSSMIASFVMGLLLYYCLDYNLFVLIFTGGIVYLLCLYLFRGIEKKDIELLFGMTKIIK